MRNEKLICHLHHEWPTCRYLQEDVVVTKIKRSRFAKLSTRLIGAKVTKWRFFVRAFIQASNWSCHPRYELEDV